MKKMTNEEAAFLTAMAQRIQSAVENRDWELLRNFDKLMSTGDISAATKMAGLSQDNYEVIKEESKDNRVVIYAKTDVGYMFSDTTINGLDEDVLEVNQHILTSEKPLDDEIVW